MSQLEKFLLPITEKISDNKYLQAINAAFLALFPVTITGSLFYIIAKFPIVSFAKWLSVTGFQSVISVVPAVTLRLIAVYTVFLVGYKLAEFNKIDVLSAGIMSLICFFIVTSFDQVTKDSSTIISYNFEWLGTKGLFVAIIVGLLTTSIITWVIRKNWTIKLPESVPPYVEKLFSSIIPAFTAATFFTVVAGLLKATTFGDIHHFIFSLLQKPLLSLGGSFSAYLFATVIIQLLWWFGIHGFNVVGSVMIPIWVALDMNRLAEMQAGKPITSFIGMSFLTAVGQGIFAILLTLYMFAKSNQLKETAKIGIPAAIFNIGEPMVFGLPTVLNPFMFIPTVILIPIVTNVFFYLGFVSGIIPPLSGVLIPMQMPIVLFGLVQGNWRLALWQLLSIPLTMVLVYPFVKLYDKQILKNENIK